MLDLLVSQPGMDPLALPQTSGDEEQPTQQGTGRRGYAAGVAIAVVVLVVAPLLVAGAVSGRFGAGAKFGTRVGDVRALQDRVEAVSISARERIMEAPLAPEFGGGFPADTSTPRPVKWEVVMKEVEGTEPAESQRFRLLRHGDSRVTLQSVHGFHIDMKDTSAKAVGAVLTDGALVEVPIAESGMFSLMYNFDDTIALRQGVDSCLAWNEKGSVYLAICDSDEDAGYAFAPLIMQEEGAVAFRIGDGYLTVVEMWVQDYQMSVLAVDPQVAEQSPTQCSKLYREPQPNGAIAFKTTRASYLTLARGKPLTASSVEVGSRQLFKETQNADGSISLSLASDPLAGYLAVQSDLTLAATAASNNSISSFVVHDNPDGTVSLFSGAEVVCAAERIVTVLTCETRKAWAEIWPMQGVRSTLMIRNVCFKLEWYGFKTKVDAYAKAMEDMVAQGQPEQLMILVDNSDMAFGGCSYEELLFRYDRIASVSGATIIAGADNAPFPTKDWPYDDLELTRETVMRAFGMGTDQYCDHSDCSEWSYKFPNSGFLMGAPKDLLTILGCMEEKGYGDFGKTGYDDQQGLQVCMFNDRRGSLVALDYSGTLSLQMIRFDDKTLYEAAGRVFNRVARGMSQCFVHGNGDTLSFWWPKLFPGSQKTEDYGKEFTV